MAQLMSTVIPLSLGAAISPTLLTALVLVLSGRVAPRMRAWATVGGAALTLFALTLAAPVVAQALHSVKPVIIDRVDVLGGVLLLALAARNVLRKHDTSESAKKRAPRTASDKAHLLGYLGFGVVLIATDFSSTILYLAALKDIASANIATAEKYALVLIPFSAVMAPALIPTALSTLAPRLSDRALKPVAAWTGAHSTAITVAICAVFGVYLIVRGLLPLVH